MKKERRNILVERDRVGFQIIQQIFIKTFHMCSALYLALWRVGGARVQR